MGYFCITCHGELMTERLFPSLKKSGLDIVKDALGVELNKKKGDEKRAGTLF